MKEYIERDAARDLMEQALVDEWEIQYADDRLDEIPAADVVEVPCRVGAMTYTPDIYFGMDYEGDPIIRFVIEEDGVYFETRDYEQRPVSELGKTVFLTLEEVEATIDGGAE